MQRATVRPRSRDRAALPEADDGGTAFADGRRQRSANSRRRIVEAMITLVRDGNLSPGAEAVSRQADVSLRTVFRHFEDMDSLYREMSAVVEAEVLPLVEAPLDKGPWPELLSQLVARRARVFERIMPFKLAGNLRRHQSELLTRRHDEFRDAQRHALQQLVPSTLRSSGPRFEALDLLLSFESWHRLRSEQGLDVAQAEAVLYDACLVLTTAPPAAQARDDR